MRQFQDLLDRCPEIVCHNAMYDIGWMKRMGMRITSKVWDTMLMAPILDENRMRYSLNVVAQDYLGEKKSEVFYMKQQKNGVSMQRMTCGDYHLCMLDLTQNKMRSLALKLFDVLQ